MSGPPNEGRGRGRGSGDRSAGGLLRKNYFADEEPVPSEEQAPPPPPRRREERAPSPPPAEASGGAQKEPNASGEDEHAEVLGLLGDDFAAVALRELLAYDDPPLKKTQRSFQLPAKYTTALQRMRAHLQENEGFSASEASMSNLVAAMINQWHEGMFGRPIGR